MNVIIIGITFVIFWDQICSKDICIYMKLYEMYIYCENTKWSIHIICPHGNALSNECNYHWYQFGHFLDQIWMHLVFHVSISDHLYSKRNLTLIFADARSPADVVLSEKLASLHISHNCRNSVWFLKRYKDNGSLTFGRLSSKQIMIGSFLNHRKNGWRPTQKC